MDIQSLPEIIEIKQTLDGQQKQFRCRLLEIASKAVKVLFISTRAYQVSDLPLPAGTVTFGHFWFDRPYNVYHWLDPAGRTLGHYFNLSADTTVDDGILRWRDLAIDILVRPGNTSPEILDEHEIPSSTDAATRAIITAARTATLAQIDPCIAALEAYADRQWPNLFDKRRS